MNRRTTAALVAVFALGLASGFIVGRATLPIGAGGSANGPGTPTGGGPAGAPQAPTSAGAAGSGAPAPATPGQPAGAGQPGPGAAMPASGSPQPVPSPLAATGTGSFSGALTGSAFSAHFQISASTPPATGKVSLQLDMPARSVSASLNLAVACLVPTGPGEAIIGGTVGSDSQAGLAAPGTGFVLAFRGQPPAAVSFELGFPLGGQAAGVCQSQAGELFGASHPGFVVAAGSTFELR